MESRIRIKLKGLEVEFEGSEEYLRSELVALIEQFITCVPEEVFSSKEEPQITLPTPEPSPTPAPIEPEKAKLELSLNTIASTLDVKSGPGLVLATCAYLTFNKNQNTFNNKDILREMQKADNYYRKSYGNNLERTLANFLKKKKLIETRADTYALEAQTRKELEQALGIQ